MWLAALAALAGIIAPIVSGLTTGAFPPGDPLGWSLGLAAVALLGGLFLKSKTVVLLAILAAASPFITTFVVTALWGV